MVAPHLCPAPLPSAAAPARAREFGLPLLAGRNQPLPAGAGQLPPPGTAAVRGVMCCGFSPALLPPCRRLAAAGADLPTPCVRAAACALPASDRSPLPVASGRGSPESRSSSVQVSHPLMQWCLHRNFTAGLSPVPCPALVAGSWLFHGAAVLGRQAGSSPLHGGYLGQGMFL